MLHHITVNQYTTYHELHRVINVERAGFTDKELEFMKGTLDQFNALNERMSKFNSYIQRTL